MAKHMCVRKCRPIMHSNNLNLVSTICSFAKAEMIYAVENRRLCARNEDDDGLGDGGGNQQSLLQQILFPRRPKTPCRWEACVCVCVCGYTSSQRLKASIIHASFGSLLRCCVCVCVHAVRAREHGINIGNIIAARCLKTKLHRRSIGHCRLCHRHRHRRRRHHGIIIIII